MWDVGEGEGFWAINVLLALVCVCARCWMSRWMV